MTLSLPCKAGQLADIPEERTRENRQAKLNMKDNQQDTNEASKDTHLQEFSRIGHDRRRKNEGGGFLDESFTKDDVFQNRLIRKPSQFLEQGSAHEERLVAINNPATSTPKVIQKRDKLESPIIARELMHEASCLNPVIGFHHVQSLYRAGRQKRVGMKKQQPFAIGDLCPRIHLYGTTLRG